MRIPGYFRHSEWQRFFAGVSIGAMVSWCIFLYIFGQWQEEYSKEIMIQQKEIQELINEKRIWQQDIEELNKKNQEKLTIQEIKVRLVDHERFNLDPFSVYEIEKAIEEDLGNLIAKDIETAFMSSDLIEKAIENRTFKMHDKRYRLKVKKIVFYSTLTIELNLLFDS